MPGSKVVAVHIETERESEREKKRERKEHSYIQPHDSFSKHCLQRSATCYSYRHLEAFHVHQI